MLEEYTDLGIIRLMLNGIMQNCDRKCRAILDSRPEPLSIDEINEILQAEWMAMAQSRGFAAEMEHLTSEEKAAVQNAYQEIFNSLENYSLQSPPPIGPESTGVDWLTAERKADRWYWKLCERQMLQDYPSSVVSAIDRDSEKILAHLHDPKDSGRWDTRGLVVGQVQSGKTANYTALICKAADAGYKLIIVLSGMHNDLRQQTQKRLDKCFGGFTSQKDDATGTVETVRCGVGNDPEFRKNENRRPVSGTLSEDFKDLDASVESRPWLMVVKKNKTRLENLIRWIKKIHDPSQCPLLLIDDEADQASIDTVSKSAGSPGRVSLINGLIRQILNRFPKFSFVAYTATPFANVFIDAEADSQQWGKDLFPKDFIYRLPVPTNYVGPSVLFGDELDEIRPLIKVIDKDEANAWLKKVTGRTPVSSYPIPPGLRDCVLQFFLSSAIKSWRDSKRSDNAPESSMLIHVTHRVREQSRVGEQMAAVIEELREAIECGDEAVRKRLHELWTDQCENVTPLVASLRRNVDTRPTWNLPDSFETALDMVREAVLACDIMIVNGKRKEKVILSPAYTGSLEQRPLVHIYVGGNKLSRGLTLPGLCVSFFLRGSTMYDTLLQMGRWFGYRDGYVDLCRLCSTSLVIERFRGITEAIADFERQIDEMALKDRNPANYRLKILQHPGLLITARNKMRTATQAVVNFSGFRQEERRIDLSRRTMLDNIAAAEALYKAILSKGNQFYDSAHKSKDHPASFYRKSMTPDGRAWRNVPAEAVAAFLSSYMTENGVTVAQQGMAAHIRKMVQQGELTDWNVFIPGVPDPSMRFGSLPVIRNKADQYGEAITTFHLRSLKTGYHEFVGVRKDLMDQVESQIDTDKRGARFDAVRREAGRKDVPWGHPEEGYLILYLLSPDDEDREKLLRNPELTTSSTDLGARDGKPALLPMVSYYLWIPESESTSKMSMAAFNSTVTDAPEDLDDDSDIDDQDENEEDDDE